MVSFISALAEYITPLSVPLSLSSLCNGQLAQRLTSRPQRSSRETSLLGRLQHTLAFLLERFVLLESLMQGLEFKIL